MTKLTDKEILDFVRDNLTLDKEVNTNVVLLDEVRCTIRGDVIGDVWGDIKGDVLGDVAGNVRGNVNSMMNFDVTIAPPKRPWEMRNFDVAIATPKRPWAGLTDEEIEEINVATWDEDHKSWGIHDFARAIEAKLKEKNT